MNCTGDAGLMLERGGTHVGTVVSDDNVLTVEFLYCLSQMTVNL